MGERHTVQKTEGATTTKSIYNAEGRLQRVETDIGDLIGEYRYDPLGRRIQKTTPTETRYFHYTEEGLAGEYDSSGQPIQQYGYAPDSTWTTNPLYTKTAQGYAFYQTDHLGTPQQLVQSNGTRVWQGEYRAFGEVNETNQTWSNPLRFPGQYYDRETGLYYNYFRDYDPSIGRYVQGDPIGLGGGLNTFLYVKGNPTKYCDESGLQVGNAVRGMAYCLMIPACRKALQKAIKVCKDIRCKIKTDPPHHSFPEYGGLYCEHYRLTCWKKGNRPLDRRKKPKPFFEFQWVGPNHKCYKGPPGPFQGPPVIKPNPLDGWLPF